MANGVLEGVLVCRERERCFASCGRMGFGALEPQVREGTHSLASSIVFSVIFIVSIVFDSINVIKTLRTEATCNGGGGWHAQPCTHPLAERFVAGAWLHNGLRAGKLHSPRSHRRRCSGSTTPPRRQRRCGRWCLAQSSLPPNAACCLMMCSATLASRMEKRPRWAICPSHRLTRGARPTRRPRSA